MSSPHLVRAACALVLAVQAAPAVATFSTERLGEGIYAIRPTTVVGFGNDANSLLVVGDREALVVDAQFSAESTDEVIRAVRRLTPVPVRWLVNTHWHDDHVTGNGAWKRAYPDLRIVGHRGMREDLLGAGATNRAGFRKAIPGTSAFLMGLVSKKTGIDGQPTDSAELTAIANYATLIQRFAADTTPGQAAAPDSVFEDSLRIQIGRHPVVLRWLGRGHTAWDVVADLPADGLVATGDPVVWPIPLIGTTSYPREYGQTLRRLAGLGRGRYLPGHGPVLTGNAQLDLTRDLVESISRQVDSMRLAGDSLPTIRKAVRLDSFRTKLAGNDRLLNEVFQNYVVSSAIPKAYADGKGARQ